MPESVAVNIRGRSYKILADVEISDANCSGVIFAHGSRFGGHALFIKDKKLYYVYNFLGIKPEQKFVSPELKPGKYTLGDGVHPREGRARTTSRSARRSSMSTTRSWPKARCGRRRASSRCPATASASAATAADAVSKEYKTPGEFKGGTIQFVGVTIEKAQYLDLETLAAAAMALD